MARRNRPTDERDGLSRKAIDLDWLDSAIETLAERARREPRDPEGPRRLGDALRRAGHNERAEHAYRQAMHRFADRGLLPQAVAAAKLAEAVSPERADIVDEIDPEAARALRRRPPPGQDRPSAPKRGPGPPPLRRRSSGPEADGAAAQPADDARPLPTPRPELALPEPLPEVPHFIGGIPREGMATAARALEPAADAVDDEVRFDDVPAEERVEIRAADLDAIAPSSKRTEKELGRRQRSWSAKRLAHLSAATLFGDVSRSALRELAWAAELVELRPGDAVVRGGKAAEALYVVVEGTAQVVLPWMKSGGVDLAAGQVLGETCLLDGATHQADVIARTELVMLRIVRTDLQRIAAEHAEVHELLFELLVERMVANTLQTAPIFVAFAQAERSALASMFEVRLARAGTSLQQRGKRSDGLYLLLAGELAVVEGGRQVPLPQGAMIGHRSLLSRRRARRTIVASSQSLLLRMPARRFAEFADRYPRARTKIKKLAAKQRPR